MSKFRPPLVDPPRSGDPVPYDITQLGEITRLFRELEGYMRVSLLNGTDAPGRAHAYAALTAINSRRNHIEFYIRAALAELDEEGDEPRGLSVGEGASPEAVNT